MFSEVIGREIKFVQSDMEDLKKELEKYGFAEERIKGWIQTIQLTDKGVVILTDNDRKMYTNITGEKPTSLKTWVRRAVDIFK